MKQQHIPWIGPIVESLLVALPFLGIINFICIAITMYTSIKPYIVQYAPWLTIWIFLGSISAIVVIMMFLIWKIVLSSLWKFRGKQMLEDKLLSQLDIIQKDITELKNK